MKINRLGDLDVLRGIAALWVMIFHYTYAMDHSITSFIPSHGYLGVDLFFIISGFVIFMSIEKSKNKFDFIISRVSRLYPSYWLAIVLTVLVMMTLPFNEIHISLKIFIVNLTMLQYWFKVQNIDGAYWTLGYELSFYFIIYLLYRFKLLNYFRNIGLLFLIIQLYYTVYGYKNILFSLLPCLKYWHLFFSGMIFYKSFSDTKINVQNAFAIALSLIIAWFGAKDLGAFIIVLTFFSIFVWFIYRRYLFPIKSSKYLIVLGQISYPLYLLHENIGIQMIKSLEYYAWCNYFMSRLITICIMIVSAWIFTYVFEKRAIDISKKLLINIFSFSLRSKPVYE